MIPLIQRKTLSFSNGLKNQNRLCWIVRPSIRIYWEVVIYDYQNRYITSKTYPLSATGTVRKLGKAKPPLYSLSVIRAAGYLAEGVANRKISRFFVIRTN